MHAQHQADSATPDPAVHRIRRVTSFRSRRSSLTETQQEVWDRLWPRLGRQALPAEGEPVEPIDADAWFGRHAPGGLVCEIGCGTGTSTLAMAQAEPGIDVIAVEVYRRGLAQLLCAIDRAADREAVTNIRLVRGDGVDVLEHLIGPETLTGVRVFFPDPWPKSRHHKRRLLQPSTMALIADRLRPGGVLHAATDHAGYAEQIAEAGDGEPRLRRAAINPRVASLPPAPFNPRVASLPPAAAAEALPISVQRPITKYETKAGEAGRAVTELIWVKRA